MTTIVLVAGLLIAMIVLRAATHSPRCTRCHSAHMPGSVSCLDIEFGISAPADPVYVGVAD